MQVCRIDTGHHLPDGSSLSILYFASTQLNSCHIVAIMIFGQDSILLSQPAYHSLDHCGYCDGNKGDGALALPSLKKYGKVKPQSISMGCSVQEMKCEDYDKLINMGYRRSGTFLYKPDLLRGCCRLFTIRTNLEYLKINKLHRQVVNRFTRAISPPSEEYKSRKEKNLPFKLSTLVTAELEADKSVYFTRFEPSKFSQEKYELYKKYQIGVHNDKPEDITPQGFTRFLCDSPFVEEEDGEPETWKFLNNWKGSERWPRDVPRRIGPTHECYYYKGKLIAISVLDFLPSGVSSIYFIWDPDYPHLSLGTLSGLKEMYMCDALDLGYYYLGYYVDDCEKMKYKKKFGGEVLDIANLTYIPFEGMDNILQGGKFFTLRPTKNYDSKIEPLWCLTSKGFPFDYNPRLIRIENVAEDVYGDMERVESDAATALTQLCKKYDICTKSDIPLVLPGIIPIHQIIEMFAFEDVKNQYFNLIYVTSVERILKPFRYLSKKEKRIVLDTIRLFGLELTSRMFIML